MSDVFAPEDISARIPPWVPKETYSYLAHTEGGASLRALARDAGVHASTILRQVRSIEARREDVLVDLLLQRWGRRVQTDEEPARPAVDDDLSGEQLKRESCRVLGHLADPAAVLAVVADMEKAVIVHENADGDTTRRATLDRTVAEALAFKGWIACDTPGKVLKYRITTTGRAALGKIMAQSEMRAIGRSTGQSMGQSMGLDEDQSAVQRDTAHTDLDGQGTLSARQGRFQSNETPLALLARRRDKDGQHFIGPDLVAVGERTHEDFVLTGLPHRRDETWDQFLSRAQDARSDSPQARRAQDRLIGALRDLGPGLGDAVLRCCCCLEGLELTEKRMGWSARSGKIVLRIALQRLKRHYDALGDDGALVG
ncbi:MAG: DUF6456 domain-containing protein [Pseudomonadota bacterium]